MLANFLGVLKTLHKSWRVKFAAFVALEKKEKFQCAFHLPRFYSGELSQRQV
jgi:hypothetical protein